MAKKKTSAPADQLPVPLPMVERRIHEIRGPKVMLDRDLAELYGEKAIALRQQVKRNKTRFPADSMFQLTAAEANALVSQNVNTFSPQLRRVSARRVVRLSAGHITAADEIGNEDRIAQ